MTVCTKDRAKILSQIRLSTDGMYPYDEDGRCLDVLLTSYGCAVEKQIRKASRLKTVRIERYVIMPDHLHMIVSVWDETEKGKENPSAERIPCFISMFKKACTRELERNIFQRGYYDHVIRGIADREAIERYILCNPAKWYFEENS